MSPLGPRDQSIVDQLTEEFSAKNKGRYIVSPGRPIPIPDFNEPQPDMVLFKRGVPTERHPLPNEIYLVVEVSETTLKQDEGKKLLAYQDAGVSEYWIVDVAAKAVRIHRLNQAKTYCEETHSKDTMVLQAFPDVTIDLGNLF
jgi:Uma2 family endonuclease